MTKQTTKAAAAASIQKTQAVSKRTTTQRIDDQLSTIEAKLEAVDQAISSWDLLPPIEF